MKLYKSECLCLFVYVRIIITKVFFEEWNTTISIVSVKLSKLLKAVVE